MKRQSRIEKKQIEAQRRQESYDKLSPKDRIQKLDKKLGKGIGAVKERARYLKEE